MDIRKRLTQNKVLTIAIALACLIALAHVLFCTDVFNDVASSHGPMASAFGRGDWYDAFPENVPPLLPSLAGIFCLVGIEPLTALIIVSSLFYVLAIFPLYHLLKLWLKPELAALGCLLYVTVPKIIRFSCTGLPDAGRNFFLIAAVWLLLSHCRRHHAAKLAGLALCLSGLALVRAEGIVYLPLFLIWFVPLRLRGGKGPLRGKIAALLKELGIALVILLLAVAPRMYQVYRLTGIPAIDSRQADVITGLLDFSLPVVQSDDAIVLPETGASLKHALQSRLVALLECFCNGSYVPYLMLAVIGVLLLRRHNQLSLEHWLLLSFVICNAAIFFVIVMSERFFNVNILLLMPFTVPVCAAVYAWLCARGMRQIALTGFAALLTIQACVGANNAFNLKNNYRAQVGKWLLDKQPELLQETGKTDLNRKLVILSDRPQYAFWAEADWTKTTGKKSGELPPLEVLQAQNVDIAVTGKDDSPLYFQLLKSPHFKQMQTPFNTHTAVFLFIPDKNAPDYVPADDAFDSDDPDDNGPAMSRQ